MREKQRIAGPCGLFLSNEPAEKVLAWFQSYGEQDYPRSGFEATQDVSLEAGPLPQFSHSIEPHLRQLGMPVELKQGIVTVRHSYTVCKKGDTLNPEQCKILVRFQIFVWCLLCSPPSQKKILTDPNLIVLYYQKLLDIKMSEFKFTFKCYWHDGKFVDLEGEAMEE